MHTRSKALSFSTCCTREAGGMGLSAASVRAQTAKHFSSWLAGWYS